VDKIEDGRLFSPAAAGKEQERNGGDHIFVRSNSKFFKVNFSEIVYIQGMKDYLKIHTPEYTLVTHQTMNELEKLLPARQFIRVHKSYIIAISHIHSIYGNSIELGKVTIPIGITTAHNSTTIIETLVGLGRDMKMEIIAEGVETFEQVQHLRERGIRKAQGYVFAPPLPGPSFLQLLEASDPKPASQSAGAADDSPLLEPAAAVA